MCGRYTLHTPASEVAKRFQTPPLIGLEPRYNVAPTQDVAVVTQNGGRHLAAYRWGLVPAWAKDAAIGSRMINARMETLTEKPAFRRLLKSRRCIIPADGFYEWREADNPEEGGRTPMYIRRTDAHVFGFAGLWDEWKPEDGPPMRTCTIITTAPNSVVAGVHNRMPVILPVEDEEHWLDPELTDPQALVSLLLPFAGPLEMYEVSRQVNRATTDTPSNILPRPPREG